MLAAIALAAAAAQGPAASDGAAAGGAFARVVDAAVDRARRRDTFCGAVLVARDGEVLAARGYGLADRQSARTRPDTLFDVASVSKQFTAAAVLRLHDQRRLGLFDPIGEHLPDVPADKRAITVHHLLSHRSGLPGQIAWTDRERADRDAMLRAAWAAELRAEPGELFAYSNLGYGVLAAVVEHVAREPFERFVERELLRPAGMRHSGFPGDETLRGLPAARRWQHPGDERFGDTALDWPWHWAFKGATGLVTNVRDLYRWHRALAAGEVLSAASRDRLWHPVEHDYALGIESRRTPWGTRHVMHDGLCYGFRAVYSSWPDDDALIAVTTNLDADPRRIEQDLREPLFARALRPELLAACAGEFAFDGEGTVELRADGGRLVAVPRGRAACARLLTGTAAPREVRELRAYETGRALDAIAPLLRGHRRAAFAAFGGEDRAAAAWSAWRAEVRERGAYRDAVVRDAGAGAWTLAIACARGDSVWRLEYDGAAVRDFARAEPPPPVPVRWLRGRRFVVETPRGRERIELELTPADGPATRLRWRDLDDPDEPATLRRR